MPPNLPWFIDGSVRVVNTSSIGHRFAPKGGIDYATLVPNDAQADEARNKMGKQRLYGQSKWVGFNPSKYSERLKLIFARCAG